MPRLAPSAELDEQQIERRRRRAASQVAPASDGPAATSAAASPAASPAAASVAASTAASATVSVATPATATTAAAAAAARAAVGARAKHREKQPSQRGACLGEGVRLAVTPLTAEREHGGHQARAEQPTHVILGERQRQRLAFGSAWG